MNHVYNVKALPDGPAYEVAAPDNVAAIDRAAELYDIDPNHCSVRYLRTVRARQATTVELDVRHLVAALKEKPATNSTEIAPPPPQCGPGVHTNGESA